VEPAETREQKVTVERGSSPLWTHPLRSSNFFRRLEECHRKEFTKTFLVFKKKFHPRRVTSFYLTLPSQKNVILSLFLQQHSKIFILASACFPQGGFTRRRNFVLTSLANLDDLQDQGCQIVSFQTNLGILWRTFEWKML
jgi:hypothetical protein